MSTILLVDNGSSKPGSTLNLRRIAHDLGLKTGHTIYPVSLQHAHRVPAELLDGTPALTFEPFMRNKLTEGERTFIVLPLFFGPSRALTNFIPDHLQRFTEEFDAIDLSIADVLCPLPPGEQRLAQILNDQIAGYYSDNNDVHNVILVDHGSPIPEVTAVRNYLGSELEKLLPEGISLHSAVMERRKGSQYDFNGILLEELLDELAGKDPGQTIALALLFLSPGRHAGPGGDIEEIAADAEQRNPGLNIVLSPLVGQHPGLIDILADRLSTILT